MTEELLAGVRVLDLSRVLAGPYAASILAQLGADVVKVEAPSGDSARQIGPFQNGESLYFAAVNSGKRGVVLDLASDEGRTALHQLLEATDIVIENFLPASAQRLGTTPQQLLERNPQLVVVTVSGFARDSQWAERPALDLVVQAEAGIMSVTGEPGGEPVRCGVPVGDLAAGLWASLAATSAYAARLRDGRGRHVEVPLLDATLSLLSYMAPAAMATGTDPTPVGSGHHSVVPYGAFPCRDGWMVIAVIGDPTFPRLCRALGLEELTGDAALEANEARVGARERVEHAIAAVTTGLLMEELAGRLRDARVPHAPVNGVHQALSSPYVQERGLVQQVEATPPYHLVRGPLPAAVPRPAPRLGEHTQEVLTEVGQILQSRKR